MKKIVSIITTIGLLLSLPLFLTGCWDSQEPEKLAIVIVAGYDYNPETDMYKIIIQIESPLTRQGSQGGAPNKPPYWTVSAWGYTPIDAVANIRKKASREIFYSHLHLLVISDKLLKTKGIITVLDALARTRQSRPIVYLATTGEDVEDILTIDYPIESANAVGLINQLEITDRGLAASILENARQFLIKLEQPGIEPVAVNLKLMGKEQSGGGNTGGSSGGKTGGSSGGNSSGGKDETSKPSTPPPIKIDGLGVFNKDKLVGKLNDRETRGWSWIAGQATRGIVNITYPKNKSTILTIVTKLATNKITPVIRNGKPAIKLDVEVSGRVEAATGIVGFKESSSITQSLKNRLAAAVRNDMKLAIDKARSLNSDIFGFGNAFYRLKYKEWKKYEDKWDEIFASLPVEINVETNIFRTGMVNKGLKLK